MVKYLFVFGLGLSPCPQSEDSLRDFRVERPLVEGGSDEDPPSSSGIRLSLRQSIHLALNHNLDIEVARYQPWIEDQNILAALGTFDVVLYANGAYNQSYTPTGSALSGAETLEQDTTTLTVGVKKLLPFGTTVDASYYSERLDTNSSFYTLVPQWTEKAGVTVTVPLLRGAGVTSNYSSILISRNNREISIYQFEKSLTEAVYGVHEAYWGLVFSIENKKVKEQSLAVARKLRDENQKKYEHRIVARIDVTQAEAGVASQEEGILTAEAQVLNAADRLKRVVDPALLRSEEPVWPTDVPRGYDEEIDESASVRRAFADALAHRPDYLQIAREIDSLDVTIVKSERDLLPRVDLQGGAYAKGVDDSFGFANSGLFSLDGRELVFGLVVEYPLGTRSARGTLNKAELEKRRSILRRRSLEDQLLVEVREAVRRLKTDEKRIQATRKARILAQEQFDAELKRKEQGLSTTFRVLDVQKELTLALSNEIKAKIDYRLSLANLDRASGTLLTTQNIRLNENLAPRVALR